MDKKFKEIWLLAKPYLKKGKRRDFVLHTKAVIRVMELILQNEQGDPDILIPAAMLHDVGWARVPKKLQKSKKDEEKHEALVQHLKMAPPIINNILKEVDYQQEPINQIIDIVLAHKFQDPTELDKKLLIDADGVTDAFPEQFKSDLKSYSVTPQQLFNFCRKNEFYTKTARDIFGQALEERKREYSLQ